MGGSLPRLAILAILVLGLSVLVVWFLLPESAQDPGPRAGPETCMPCHADVAAEWTDSGHAVSWTSKALAIASVRFQGLTDCVACHAPAPLRQTQGTPPPHREAARQHGVDCIACHALAGGGVAAARDRPDAPCRPTQSSELLRAASCGRCHRAVHDDWTRAPSALQGTGCLDCHMPSVDRADGRTGRRHGHRPSRDPVAIANALTLSARVVGDQLDVSIGNRIAHNVPGERHFRVLWIEIEVQDASGTVTFSDRIDIKMPTLFRKERVGDQIAAGATWANGWKLTEASGTARVRLFYKRYKRWLDSQADVIIERVVKF